MLLIPPNPTTRQAGIVTLLNQIEMYAWTSIDAYQIYRLETEYTKESADSGSIFTWFKSLTFLVIQLPDKLPIT